MKLAATDRDGMTNMLEDSDHQFWVADGSLQTFTLDSTPKTSLPLSPQSSGADPSWET